MKTITTYEEAVAYLLQIPRFTSKNTMEDTKAFLHLLGDPDRRLKIIHVAGTNGKGSVCAYLRCILEEAGYAVAVFTSPHLVEVTERFVIRGSEVTKEAFLDAFLAVYEAVLGQRESGYHPTFFEWLFFMAMLLFAQQKPDYCILETGLGGRLDATNAVAQKELAVITRIGLDHTEYLGDTLGQIAGEKAGIISASAPVVFTDCDEEVTQVFCKKAAENGISAYPVSKKDYRFLKFKNKSIDFSLHSEYYGYISLTLCTQARYQMENVALAVRAAELLDQGRRITREDISRGVERCRWQGRMEEVLPEVYVDGAHNADGIRAFLETVAQDHFEGERTLLFGVVKEKAYQEMAERLVQCGLFQKILAVPLQTGRTLEAETLQETIGRLQQRYGIRLCCEKYADVETALGHLLSERKANERIYIAGSLYLVGEVKAYLAGRTV